MNYEQFVTDFRVNLTKCYSTIGGVISKSDVLINEQIYGPFSKTGFVRSEVGKAIYIMGDSNWSTISRFESANNVRSDQIYFGVFNNDIPCIIAVKDDSTSIIMLRLNSYNSFAESSHEFGDIDYFGNSLIINNKVVKILAWWTKDNPGSSIVITNTVDFSSLNNAICYISFGVTNKIVVYPENDTYPGGIKTMFSSIGNDYSLEVQQDLNNYVEQVLSKFITV